MTEKILIAYSYFNANKGFLNLDVLLNTPIDFELMWRQKQQRLAGKTVINLVSVEHLIQLKTYSNRIQDKNDVLLLSKLIK